MNDNPKAASTQESIAFHFDFADATDPAKRERPLMEEPCRTQSALAEADIEIKQKQRALAERAFEQEAADARDLLHAACRTADFDDEGNPTGSWFSDECRRILGYETREGLQQQRKSWCRRCVSDTPTTAIRQCPRLRLRGKVQDFRP